jgi:hypothetical protein
MNNINLEKEIMEVVHQMTEEQQRELLKQAHRLKRPKGTPGKLAIQYARELAFNSEDLAEMEQAINEAFEKPAGFTEVELDE